MRTQRAPLQSGASGTRHHGSYWQILLQKSISGLRNVQRSVHG